MARINGVNSDYQWSNGQIQEVEPTPTELDLKLFICPYKKPSHLESDKDYCDGTDRSCPNEKKAGHALIHLNQANGIELVTDGNNHLALSQNGNISLCPTDKGKVEVNGALAIQRNVEINGNLVIQKKDGTNVFLHIAEDQISLEVSNGAKVVIGSDGKLDLFTKGNAEKVTIHGNLHVTGDITYAGNVPTKVP